MKFKTDNTKTSSLKKIRKKDAASVLVDKGSMEGNMSIILKLKRRMKQLQVALDSELDFLEIYENLELIRIYLELLDGDPSPAPVRVPGTTINLFGRNFFPPDPKSAMERIETEIRINSSLYLYPHLIKQQSNIYEQPFSPFRSAVESIRVQIERWLVLHEVVSTEQQEKVVASRSISERKELTALVAS